jgi:DNA-binding transcriptional regulator YhcF (GntR family)
VKGKSFFLDTNVVLYLHFPQSTNSDQARANTYSNFISDLRQKGCSLRISTLTVQEAFYAIETAAFLTYRNDTKTDISRKSFRRQQRNEVHTMQMSLWKQVKANYSIENASVNTDMLESFIEEYLHHYYDPIDYLLKSNYPELNIITNDGDFSNDASINVFTH